MSSKSVSNSSGDGNGLKPLTQLDSQQNDQDKIRPSLSILQTKHNQPLSPTHSSLSRASSGKSTSSVQAVPIKIPIRSTSSIKLTTINSELTSHEITSTETTTTTTTSIHYPIQSIQSSSNCPILHPLPSFHKLSIEPQSIPTPSIYSHHPNQSYSSDLPLINSPSSNNQHVPKRIQDLIVGDVLGEGSYSTVYHVVDKSINKKEYALKVLDKRHIQKEKKTKYVAIERDCLNLLHYHPGCITLFSTFQDEFSLYYLLELVPNGEILKLIKLLGSFSTNCARFYSTQILSAIEHMHNRGVIHRDIKPENILLDSKMRVKIADYGSAKILPHQPQNSPPTSTSTSTTSDKNNNFQPEDTAHQRSHSFVGTADYVSPELLIDKVTSKSSDLWAFGCVLFQMMVGLPPFRSRSEYLTFQKITKLEYSFPEKLPSDAKDLISKLLTLNPRDRLSIDDIKTHHFYDSIDWDEIWEIEPPNLQSGLVNSLAQPNELPTPISTPMMINYPVTPMKTNFPDGFDQEQPTHTPVLQPPNITIPLIYEENDGSLEADNESLEGADAILEADDASPKADVANLEADNSSLEADDASLEADDRLARTVSKRSPCILYPTRQKFGDDEYVALNSGEMNWVEIFLPNELVICSSPVNELTINQEEINSPNNNNFNEKLKLLKSTISQKHRRKKKRVLILTNFPRLLCIKEDEKNPNKGIIKYEILFKPLPTISTTPIKTTATGTTMNRRNSSEVSKSDSMTGISLQPSSVPPRPSSSIPLISSSSLTCHKQLNSLLFKKIEIHDNKSFRIESVIATSNLPKNNTSTSKTTSPRSNNKNVDSQPLIILRFEDKSGGDNDNNGQNNNNKHDDDDFSHLQRWCDEINLAFRLANPPSSDLKSH